MLLENINDRSLMRILKISFLSLTKVNRDVLSAKSFTLSFNLLGKSLM